MDQGGSIAMAVMNAQYKHPSDASYSQGSRDLIDSMLKADPKQRPDIHEVRPLVRNVNGDSVQIHDGEPRSLQRLIEYCKV